MSPSNENISETEEEAENQEPKGSRLAEYSALVTLLAVLVALITAPSLLCAPFAITGIALGIIALWQISRSRGKLSGLVPAIFAIVINSTLPFVILHFEYVRKTNFELAQRVVCGTHLSELCKAIQNYSDENNGKYPTADKWCDLLIQGNYATEKQFVCPSSEAERGQSSYALNKNIVGMKVSDISPDVALLFESKTGWNQFAGPELLAPENHGGRGCNILFNDGHVDFVETDKLGELKWK